MFLPFVDLNHLGGCDEWQASGCKACFKRQGPDSWHKSSTRASRPLKGFLLFFSSSNGLWPSPYEVNEGIGLRVFLVDVVVFAPCFCPVVEWWEEGIGLLGRVVDEGQT